MRTRTRLVVIGGLLALAALIVEPTAAFRQSPPAEVLVFAASSLQTALDELAPQMDRAAGVHVTIAYAASSAAARQIEQGAPAHIFISADADWMDYLATRRLIRTETRVTLLGNTLVLIAPATQPVRLTIGPKADLAGRLGSGRLAVADPASVPAGKYAKAALTSLGVWDSVASKLAPAENVRAALLLVARGEAPLGIVYRTDAQADRRVTIVDTFPANTHSPIVYPAAVTLAGGPAATRVVVFLRGPAARAVFAGQGFLVDVK